MVSPSPSSLYSRIVFPSIGPSPSQAGCVKVRLAKARDGTFHRAARPIQPFSKSPSIKCIMAVFQRMTALSGSSAATLS